MFGRIGFACINAWQQRARLRAFLTTPALQVRHLHEITAERIDAANVAVLVLDFDGVLASHGEVTLAPKVEHWLKHLSSQIGEQRIALLTNKPIPERLAYFSKHFPSIQLIQDVRKKPYPDGLLEAAAYRGVSAHRVLLVDDRLCTGMLATCLAYSQGWYFTHPKTNFAKTPVRESFFCFLRFIERLFVRCG